MDNISFSETPYMLITFWLHEPDFLKNLFHFRKKQSNFEMIMFSSTVKSHKYF